MSDTATCQSCGMPMESAAEHGAGKPDNLYCYYCTEPDGALQPFEVHYEKMVGWMMSKERVKRAAAEAATRAYMAGMPAWREHFVGRRTTR